MDNFFAMQFKDVVNFGILLATIFAIYYGPIKAVEISRKNQEEDARRQRQFGVFHNLIKTRRFLLSPDHVSALNLVQLEFYGNERIQGFYKTYMGFLHGVWPKPEDDNWVRFNEAKDNALYDLIHEIGLVLGFRIDRQELKSLAYGPQGWENDETQGRILRSLLIQTFEGKRGLPVVDFAKSSQQAGKFPPPP